MSRTGGQAFFRAKKLVFFFQGKMTEVFRIGFGILPLKKKKVSCVISWGKKGEK